MLYSNNHHEGIFYLNKGDIKMITKVSYRPYALGVNNTQTQPKKVNFGIRPKQPPIPNGGSAILSLLVCAYSAGELGAKEMLPFIAQGTSAALKTRGGKRLAAQLEKILGEVDLEKLLEGSRAIVTNQRAQMMHQQRILASLPNDARAFMKDVFAEVTNRMKSSNG